MARPYGGLQMLDVEFRFRVGCGRQACQVGGVDGGRLGGTGAGDAIYGFSICYSWIGVIGVLIFFFLCFRLRTKSVPSGRRGRRSTWRR